MLTKMVNGVQVTLSAEEEARVRAEWVKNDPALVKAADKAYQASLLADSPQMQSAIEEFTAILQAASISVPPSIKTNIVNRIKAKL